MTVVHHKVKAHSGVVGNEMTEFLAKHAVDGHTIPSNTWRPLRNTRLGELFCLVATGYPVSLLHPPSSADAA